MDIDEKQGRLWEYSGHVSHANGSAVQLLFLGKKNRASWTPSYKARIILNLSMLSS